MTQCDEVVVQQVDGRIVLPEHLPRVVCVADALLRQMVDDLNLLSDLRADLAAATDTIHSLLERGATTERDLAQANKALEAHQAEAPWAKVTVTPEAVDRMSDLISELNTQRLRYAALERAVMQTDALLHLGDVNEARRVVRNALVDR